MISEIKQVVKCAIILWSRLKYTGLATFHGGIIGLNKKILWDDRGFYLYDTKSEDYQIKIVNKNNVVTKEQNDFIIHSEKYFLQSDPTNDVLAFGNFSGIDMPIAWTRNYGQGRVFYTALAHTVEELFSEESLEMILNGIDWYAEKII